MNTQGDIITSLLKEWAAAAPVLVVWAVGLAVAVGRRREQPRVAMLVIVSCALNLVAALGMPVAMRFGYRLVPSSTVPMLLGYVWTCLAAVCTGLLLYAAFLGRERRAGNEIA